MLYATTRNPRESFTPPWAITGERAGDGGFYVPFREPYFYRTNLKTFRQEPFLQVMAEILNLLFGTRISQWDLLFSAGGSPVRLQKIGRRTLSAERWRNTGWCFSSYVKDVSALLQDQKDSFGPWAEIGVGAALLFAVVTTLQGQGILGEDQLLDVAVDGRDYRAALSCLYGKAWGLPIGKVVCAMEESRGLWPLLHDGALQTDVLEPDSLTVDGLENLLCCEADQGEVKRFLNCCRSGKRYVPPEPLLKRLHQDLAVTMVSSQRAGETVPGVYSTHGYLISPDGARAYAGLQDYRATEGSSRWGLVFSDRSPALSLEEISGYLGISQKAAEKLLTNF